MVVRPAEAEDRPQLLNWIKGNCPSYRVPSPSGSKVEAMVDLLQRDPTLGVQLVAEEAGRLHGFASLYACLDTLIANRILVMNDLFVDPSSRNRGTGAALFDASLAYASAHGYARLDWVTAEDNRDAQRFYDRHGGRRGPWISYSAAVGERTGH